MYSFVFPTGAFRIFTQTINTLVWLSSEKPLVFGCGLDVLVWWLLSNWSLPDNYRLVTHWCLNVWKFPDGMFNAFPSMNVFEFGFRFHWRPRGSFWPLVIIGSDIGLAIRRHTITWSKDNSTHRSNDLKAITYKQLYLSLSNITVA